MVLIIITFLRTVNFNNGNIWTCTLTLQQWYTSMFISDQSVGWRTTLIICLPFRSTWVNPMFWSGSCCSISSFICIFCRPLFVLFLLAIVLSVFLRYTNSGYPFGIFKLFFAEYYLLIWYDIQIIMFLSHAHYLKLYIKKSKRII